MEANIHNPHVLLLECEQFTYQLGNFCPFTYQLRVLIRLLADLNNLYTNLALFQST